MIRKFTSLLFLILLAAATVAPAQEQSAKPDGKEVEKVFMTVTRLDLERGAAFTWWTEQVWATQAYADQGEESLTTFSILKLITRDQHLISPLPISDNTPAVDPKTAVLSNDLGVRVSAMPVHPSLNGMLPSLMAFPKADARGNILDAPGATALTLTIGMAGEPEPVSYSWPLPVKYPDIVQDAYAWLDKQALRDPALMNEKEFIITRLLPLMQFDIATAIIAAPMPEALFRELVQHDGMDDPAKLQILDQILQGNDFFILVGMDNKENPERSDTVARTAYAMNAAGKRVEQNQSAMLSFADIFEELDDEEGKSFVIFPHLGKTGPVKLMITDEPTGARAEFMWMR
jgi:hypothetical protein